MLWYPHSRIPALRKLSNGKIELPRSPFPNRPAIGMIRKTALTNTYSAVSATM